MYSTKQSIKGNEKNAVNSDDDEMSYVTASSIVKVKCIKTQE